MKKSCFTLVEVVMVVALIAVLTGIAIGGYSYAMGSARESATKSIIKQMEAGDASLDMSFELYKNGLEEIKERIEEYRSFCATQSSLVEKKPTIIRPAKKVWDRRIEEFNVSQRTLVHLRACGINTIGDLYDHKMKEEPGWYAVRELFNVVPSSR